MTIKDITSSWQRIFQRPVEVPDAQKTATAFQTGAVKQAQTGKTAQEKEADSANMATWEEHELTDGSRKSLWEAKGVSGKDNYEYQLTDKMDSNGTPSGTIKTKYNDGHYEYDIPNPGDKNNPYHVVLKDGKATASVGGKELPDVEMKGTHIQFTDQAGNVVHFHKNQLGATLTTPLTAGQEAQSKPSVSTQPEKEAATDTSPPPPPPNTNTTQSVPPRYSYAPSGRLPQESIDYINGLKMAGKIDPNLQVENLKPYELKGLQDAGVLPRALPGTPEYAQAQQVQNLQTQQMMQQMGLVPPPQQGGIGGFVQRHPILTTALAGLAGVALPMMMFGGMGGMFGGGFGGGGLGMMLPMLMMGGGGLGSMLPLLMMGGMGGGMGQLGGYMAGSAMGAAQGLPYEMMAGGILNQGNQWGGMLTQFM